MNKILLILALLLCGSLLAQEQGIRMYTSKEGLSQNSILAMAQDHLGFLWVGTQDGLNRFDGKEFRVFKNIPWDTTSLKNNYINALLADSKGRLWVGTNEGLHLFDFEKQTFIRVSTSMIYRIKEEEGQIWVREEDKLGFVEQDKKSGKYRLIGYECRNFSFKTKGVDSYADWFHLGKGYVLQVVEDSVTQVNCWDSTAATVRIPIEGEDDSEIRVRNIVKDRFGNMLFLLKAGLYRYNKEKLLLEKTNMSVKPSFRELYAGNEGELYIFSRTRRLHRLNQEQQGERVFYSLGEVVNEQPFKSELGYRLRSFLVDKYNPNVVWGSFSETFALVQFYKPTVQFKAINLENQRSKAVFAMLKQKEKLWFGIDDKIVSTADDTVQVIYDSKNSWTRVSQMLKGSKNDFWIATDGGLFNFELQEDGMLKEIDGERKKMAARSLLTMKSGHLLVGHKNISIYDPIGDSIQVEKVFKKDLEYPINSMVYDRQNNFWVGTYFGLFLFRDITDPVKQLPESTPEFYCHDEKDPASLINNYIFSILETSNGQIWISTYHGFAKAKLEEKGITFTNYTEEEGLANNAVYGILEDNQTNLWMGTNKGLSKFEPSTETFTNYLGVKGMPGEEFNGGAFHKAEDGELFFGGLEGAMRFYPYNLKVDTFIPPVRLYSMTTYPRKETFLFNGKNKDTISLKYSQNSFFLDYIGLDYGNPNAVSYAYILGNDSIDLGNTRHLQISNLEPGEHQLQIFTKKWEGQPATLFIVVARPFWRTWWFYGLLGLLLCGISYLIYRARWQQKLARLARFDQFRKETAQDFHDELGSQLTIISLFGEITKDKLDQDRETVLPYIQKVIDTSNSLYTSMKDLLWSINPEKDTIYDLLIHLKDFGDDLFDKTAIDFRSEGLNEPFVTKQLPMKYKRHILLIFKESMTNILKHAEANQVTLKVYNGNQSLKIEIQDNGKGFDQTQVTDSGNGLKNMNNRAEKINAQLTILSQNSGTQIILTCTL